jgi:hypothetical protein
MCACVYVCGGGGVVKMPYEGEASCPHDLLNSEQVLL